MSDEKILYDYLTSINRDNSALEDMAVMFIKNLPFLPEYVVEGTVWYSIWARKDNLTAYEFAREVVELAHRIENGEGPNLPSLVDKYTSLKETTEVIVHSSEAQNARPGNLN